MYIPSQPSNCQGCVWLRGASPTTNPIYLFPKRSQTQPSGSREYGSLGWPDRFYRLPSQSSIGLGRSGFATSKQAEEESLREAPVGGKGGVEGIQLSTETSSLAVGLCLGSTSKHLQQNPTFSNLDYYTCTHTEYAQPYT